MHDGSMFGNVLKYYQYEDGSFLKKHQYIFKTFHKAKEKSRHTTSKKMCDAINFSALAFIIPPVDSLIR